MLREAVAFAIAVCLAPGFAEAKTRLSGAPRASAPAATCAVPAFGLAAPYNTGGQKAPVSAAVADFDADGRLDIAAANHFDSASSVVLLRGTGAGVFTLATTTPVGTRPLGLDVADLNADGHPDLITTTLELSFDSAVEVLLNDGTGVFTRTSYPGGVFASGSAHGDFNGDGRLDVVVTNEQSRSLMIRRGDGAGGLGPPTIVPVIHQPTFVGVADLNGDGRADLAVSSWEDGTLAGTVEVLLNNGAGGFSPPTSFAVGLRSRPLVVADVNGDLRGDLVVVNAGVIDDGSVSVLLGNGTGGFGAQTVFPVAGFLDWVVVEDFNGDGDLDLAVTGSVTTVGNRGRGAVQLLLGDGSGGFGAPRLFATAGDRAVYSAAGDFNDDGRLDLAVPNLQDSVSVLLNMCGNVANISVAVTDSRDPVGVEHALTYTIQVTNHGPDPAGVELLVGEQSGLLLHSAETTSGYCAIYTGEQVARCELGNLPGIAPGNSVTVAVLAIPTRLTTLLLHAVVLTSVVDPVTSNNAAVEQTVVTAIGGRDLTIGATPSGGVGLVWGGGTVQAGYRVRRWVDGVVMQFPAGPPLPGGATAFVDPSPVPDRPNCYTVLPVDAGDAPLGQSELLCLVEGSASPSGAPPGFTLRLRRSTGNVAVLTWQAFAGPTQYGLAAYPSTGAPRFRFLPGTATSTTDSPGEVATCYVLAPLDGATPTGNSDALCAVPDFLPL